jgi:putative type I restriction enzyme hindVIIP specificity protein
MSKLGSYISVQNGYAFKSKDFIKNLSGMPVIKIGNVTGGSFIDLSSYDTISEEIARKVKSFQTKDDDILIAMTGANVGKVSRIAKGTQPCLINQRVGRFILKEDCPYSSDFIYYLVSSNKSFQYFSNTADGAAQPNISGKLIEDLEFPDISPKSANKAGKHLKVLDEKIQLNTQINQTLEQIAQALFKSWFVDFDPVRAKVQALSDGLSPEQAELAAMQTITGKTPEELTALSQTQPDRYAELAETAKAFPCEMLEVDGVEVPKGWEVKPLGDLISFVKGKKPKAVSPNQEENMLPHILTSSLEGKYNEFCESNKLVTVEYHNTIMLMDGSNSGRVAIGHNGVIGSTLAKINLENNKLWAIIYQFLKHKEADIQANTTGTTIPHTDKNRVNNYLMTIPNDFLLDKFTELFNNSLLKIISNRNQIISLETIRDLLLPRLLNGVI